MRISDWSSDVCSSDLVTAQRTGIFEAGNAGERGLDRKGDLRFDQFGRQGRRGNIDLNLVVGDVGHGVDRQATDRPASDDGGDHRHQQDKPRSEEHTSELQSLMRISYAVFCLKKKNKNEK